MQTKRQIQQLLASAGVSPNKRLGQHFLIDLNLMRLLVESADIAGDDVVLEVGCGTGSLTEALAERAGRIIAVEFDRNLFGIVESHLAGIQNVTLINADILESKHAISGTILNALARAREQCPGRLLLVANLPYNVASPVMVNLVTGPTIADAMYVTVQKEVAQRMTAGPGSADYGTLSIYLHATGDSQIIRTLKPAVFWPPPQVDSALVGFVRRREKVSRITNMELFTQTVHLFMGHRRKTLSACTKLAREKLAGIADWPEVFKRCGIDPTKRPEQLAPEDYVAISNQAADS
jgi:16S rRNA (adenine1518-N6/adenine1519-N6)-dimethyltransferase